MKLLLSKAKRVKNPGKRGGKFYYTDNGKVRYFSQDRALLQDFIERNRGMLIGMAVNIAKKFNLPIRYDSGQPVGFAADIAYAGMAEAYRAGLKDVQQKKGKMLTKQLMLRAKTEMYEEAARQKGIVKIPPQLAEDMRRIGRVMDKFFAEHGRQPTTEEIIDRVELRKRKSGAAEVRSYVALTPEETAERVREIREEFFQSNISPAELTHEGAEGTTHQGGFDPTERVRDALQNAVEQEMITERQYMVLSLVYGFEDIEWSNKEKLVDRESTHGAETRDYRTVADLMMDLGWKISKSTVANDLKAALKALKGSKTLQRISQEHYLGKSLYVTIPWHTRLLRDIFK